MDELYNRYRHAPPYQPRHDINAPLSLETKFPWYRPENSAPVSPASVVPAVVAPAAVTPLQPGRVAVAKPFGWRKLDAERRLASRNLETSAPSATSVATSVTLAPRNLEEDAPLPVADVKPYGWRKLQYEQSLACGFLTQHAPLQQKPVAHVKPYGWRKLHYEQSLASGFLTRHAPSAPVVAPSATLAPRNLEDDAPLRRKPVAVAKPYGWRKLSYEQSLAPGFRTRYATSAPVVAPSFSSSKRPTRISSDFIRFALAPDSPYCPESSTIAATPEPIVEPPTTPAPAKGLLNLLSFLEEPADTIDISEPSLDSEPALVARHTCLKCRIKSVFASGWNSVKSTLHSAFTWAASKFAP
jgi:hypothetical protein